jgi:two-component system response regulator HydG
MKLLKEAVLDAKRQAVTEALRDSGDNVSQAARKLGVSRVSLYRIMDRCGIRLQGERNRVGGRERG